MVDLMGMICRPRRRALSQGGDKILLQLIWSLVITFLAHMCLDVVVFYRPPDAMEGGGGE